MLIEESPLGGLFNFVADPPYGLDIFRVVRRIPHFFAQMADVDGDRVVAFAVILVLPDCMEQFLGAHHAAFPFQQDAEDGELGGGQDERFFKIFTPFSFFL